MSYAEQVSEKIDDKFIKVTNFLHLTAENLADIDTTQPNHEKSADEMVLSLINADADIFSVSFAFEVGTFRKESRFFKTYVKQDGQVKQAFEAENTLSRDGEKARWYNIPLFSGETYFKSVDYYDYGQSIGGFYVGEVSMPIKKNDRVIGVIGIDVLYQDMLKFIKEYNDEHQSTVLLLSRNGQILYAPDRRFVGSMVKDLPFPNKEALLSSMRSGENYTVESYSYFSDKESFIYAFPVRKDNELFLYFELPTENLYQKANAASRIIFSTSILGLLLLAASVFFATRNIVKPIKKITKSANQIADGQLDIVFEGIDDAQQIKQSNNEIYSLQVALKKMLEQLNQTHELKLMAIEAKFEQEKTEAESNAKTQFLAKMSHEIRTPMNAIAGMSELLLAENLSNKQQKYVRDIKISSDALLIIINDILDISKLESGNLQLLPVDYEVSSFLKNVRSIASFMAKEKGIDFLFSTKGAMPKVLLGDDVRLRQVLINVLSNAIKFTKEGHVKLVVENTGENIVYSIIDTGLGIKKEDLSNLFEPFKQLDEHKNRSIKGTGLGLSITKSIVDLMNGSIKVESEYGKGSTFKITIPLIEGNSEIISQEKIVVKTFKAPLAKVLVVDDNEINLHVASALLEFFGIKCDTALSGKEALELVQEKEYDVVFMDHMMPEMDGVETTGHIRALGEKYNKLPIIALTANAISGAKEFLITSGMNGFISKPIDKDQLQEILIKWLPKDKQETQGEVYLQEELISEEESKPPLSKFMVAAAKLDKLDVLVLQGLQNFTLQQDAYKNALLKLSRQVPFFVKNIHRVFSINDKNTFTTSMSEMRNLLAKLGAAQFAQQATDLLGAMEKNQVDLCKQNLPVFTNALEEFGTQLTELFQNTQAESDNAEQNKDYLKKSIYKLSSFLSDHDHKMSTVILAELLTHDLEETDKEHLLKVKEHLDAFDYGKARNCLEKSFTKF